MSNADTIQEFLNSYLKSWVGLKEGDKVLPASVSGGRRSNTPDILGLQCNSSPEGVPVSREITWSTQRGSLIRDFPDLGMIKLAATVGYLSTRPFRQWNKGYYPPNVKVWVPNGDDIKGISANVRFTSGHPYVLWQLYNREFWHPTEAVRLLNEGEGIGFPLSRHFGVYTKKDFESPFICYKRTTVGLYENGRWVLFDNFKAYREQFERETTVEAI